MRLKRALTAALLASCLLATTAAAAAADQVIFLVRHAERADAPGAPPLPPGTPANDPPLSAAGNERAKKLAALLASADVRHIFTSELERARQTAAPLADKVKIKAVTVSAGKPEALIEQVGKSSGNVLIVGHTNTVPELIKRLGVKTPIAIPESEFDNLFVVVHPTSGEPTLIRLRY